MPQLEVTIESPEARKLADELSALIHNRFAGQNEIVEVIRPSDATPKEIGTVIAVIAILVTLPSAVADAPQALDNIRALVEWGAGKIAGSGDTIISLGLNDAPPKPIERIKPEKLVESIRRSGDVGD
jgi:hypothetical protein